MHASSLHPSDGEYVGVFRLDDHDRPLGYKLCAVLIQQGVHPLRDSVGLLSEYLDRVQIPAAQRFCLQNVYDALDRAELGKASSDVPPARAITAVRISEYLC